MITLITLSQAAAMHYHVFSVYLSIACIGWLSIIGAMQTLTLWKLQILLPQCAGVSLWRDWQKFTNHTMKMQRALSPLCAYLCYPVLLSHIVKEPILRPGTLYKKFWPCKTNPPFAKTDKFDLFFDLSLQGKEQFYSFQIPENQQFPHLKESSIPGRKCLIFWLKRLLRSTFCFCFFLFLSSIYLHKRLYSK